MLANYDRGHTPAAGESSWRHSQLRTTASVLALTSWKRFVSPPRGWRRPAVPCNALPAEDGPFHLATLRFAAGTPDYPLQPPAPAWRRCSPLCADRARAPSQAATGCTRRPNRSTEQTRATPPASALESYAARHGVARADPGRAAGGRDRGIRPAS